jgi:hypothetical protein
MVTGRSYALDERGEIRAVELYAATRSLTATAAALGVARQTVRRAIERQRCPVAPRGKRQLRRRVTAAAHLYLLYRDRLTAQRVADWGEVSVRGLLYAVRQVEEGIR